MTEKNETENAFFDHFQTLFAFQTADVEGFTDGMPRFDYDVKEALDQPISDDEELQLKT